MSEPWLEIDCPGCGMDFDIEPPPGVGDVVTCSCGHVYTRDELGKGNVLSYEDGQLVVRPNLYGWRLP